MDLEKLKTEFAEIAAVQIRKVGTSEYDLLDATQWSVRAQTAMESCFSPSHTVLRRWNSTLAGAVGGDSWRLRTENILAPLQATFRAAADLVNAGKVHTFLDGVRAETVLELLDQAHAQSKEGHQLAATVIAGGALETHLAHLCTQHNIPWSGDGSISKYDTAIAAARNLGTVEVYSATRSKEITGWGGRRNEAAHNPTTYAPTRQAVEMYIEQIRMFVRESTPGA